VAADIYLLCGLYNQFSKTRLIRIKMKNPESIYLLSSGIISLIFCNLKSQSGVATALAVLPP